MVQATFQWKHGSKRGTGQAGFLLWFRYDEEIVRRLKAMVPSWARQWNEDNHSWWVHKDFVGAVDDLFPGFQRGVDASRRFPDFDPPFDPVADRPDDEFYWDRW